MDEKKELKKFAEFSINLGEDFFKDLKILLMLPGEHIELAAKYCDSENGFRLPKETLSKLQSEFRMDKIEEIASILRVSHFLYNQIIEEGLDRDDLITSLPAVGKKMNVEVGPEKQKAFRILFDKKEKYEEKKSVDTYATALIPSVYGISFIYDLRAVFDEEQTKPFTYLPIAVLRIRTIDDKEEKQQFVAQITEEELKNFKGHIDKALIQLDKMKNDLSSKVPLYKGGK